MGYCDSSIYTFEADEYVEQLLATRPEEYADNNYVNSLYEKIKGQTDRKTFKAVLISDPHIDFEYEVGADAKCNMPLCCRAVNGFPEDPSRQAGVWGDYMCDIPQRTFDSMMDFIKDEVQPDVFFWTGDNSPHNPWEDDDAYVAFANINTTKLIQEHFRGTNIPVFAIHGNHDTWPINIQDFSQSYSNIQINALAPLWYEWLSPEAVVKFAEHGYYSEYLKFKDGRVSNTTKVIAMNTQVCIYLNWNLIKNRYDPGNFLTWLEEELLTLEKLGQNAIIISHVPPNNGCVHSWGHRFRGLMERF